MVSYLSKDKSHTKLIKENDINLNDYKNIECNLVIELNNEVPDSLKFDSIIALDEIKGLKVSNEANQDKQNGNSDSDDETSRTSSYMSEVTLQDPGQYFYPPLISDFITIKHRNSDR